MLEDFPILTGDNMSLVSHLLNCSKEDRIKAFNLLINHPDTEPIFEARVTAIVEKVLLTSELRPIKRIAELETITGLNDYSDFEDDIEREPTIPEKINLLTEKFKEIEYKPVTATISKNIELSPTTKTELRAKLLVEDLEESGKDHFNNHDIIHFLKAKLPESCKINDNIQNIRKVKQDVIRAATRMYSENVFLNKSKNGRKETRLVLGS